MCSTLPPPLQANLEYMFKNFGFYFPDSQFLSDPEGLLKYLVSSRRRWRSVLHLFSFACTLGVTIPRRAAAVLLLQPWGQQLF